MSDVAGIVASIKAGGVIAYPTEAVFGLGCDPDNEKALQKLLAIKQRDWRKGLIIISGKFELLKPYLDLSKISEQQLQVILARWPDGITQVLPRSPHLSSLLCGEFSTIAVRVTSQPDVVAITKALGKPIVSTSANLAGQPPAENWQSLANELVLQLDGVVKNNTLGFNQPSTIIDALTGDVFRA